MPESRTLTERLSHVLHAWAKGPAPGGAPAGTDWRAVWSGFGLGLVGGAALTLLPDPFIAWIIISFGVFLSLSTLLSETRIRAWGAVAVGVAAGAGVFALWWPVGQHLRPIDLPRVIVQVTQAPGVADDLRFNINYQNRASTWTILFPRATYPIVRFTCVNRITECFQLFLTS
jgi:hypothetical protein